MNARAAIAVVATLMVAGVVALALKSIGSPSEARRVRLDERRVAELQQVGSAVDLYWTREGKPPATLAALTPTTGQAISTRDPERQVEYQYRPLVGKTYELCALFDRDGGSGFWSHGAGRGCFTLEAKTVER